MPGADQVFNVEFFAFLTPSHLPVGLPPGNEFGGELDLVGRQGTA
jgi:hypothetical protein